MPSDSKLTDRTHQSSASLEPGREGPLYRSRTASMLVPNVGKKKESALKGRFRISFATFGFWQILLQKSKSNHSENKQSLDVSAAAMLAKAATTVRGRFLQNMWPSYRRGRNASAVLKNLVRQSEMTFSTVSEQTGPDKLI